MLANLVAVCVYPISFLVRSCQVHAKDCYEIVTKKLCSTEDTLNGEPQKKYLLRREHVQLGHSTLTHSLSR